MSLRKNVKIDIDLEADTKNALTKISGALGTIRAQANTVGDDLETVEQEVNNFGDSFDKDQDLQIGGRVNSTSIRMAALSALHQADKHIGELRDPKITIRGEVDMDADKLKEDVAEEEEALNAIKDGANAATEAKERFAKENGNVRDRALASVTALDKEESSFDDIIKKGDSLTKIKQRVAGANKHVAKMSEESADELFGEESRARELAESMRIVEDSSDGLTDSMGATTRQLRKMRNRTDRTSNSMRAAAQVGEIFEDGLGSLSVNLGAFTVALRNFLTQVPLLLTALGSAGAAATGAATGFVSLAGALGAVVAAGAVSEAQRLNEEYAKLDGLGQSLNVILLNLRDLFKEAAGPLLNNAETARIFINVMEGLAGAVNVVAKSISSVTERTSEFTSAAFTVQDALSQISNQIAPAFRDVVGSIRVAFEQTGSEIIDTSADMTHALADVINFSTALFNEVTDLQPLISSFGDSLRELAILGAKIGGGLVPVFEAFTTVMKEVARALNQVDSQTMQDAITFLALVAAMNRISGVASSLITILPNLAIGLAGVSSKASQASGVFATLRASTAAASAQLGGFIKQTNILGGITGLVTALFGTEKRIREVAFNTKAAKETFEELTHETDKAADELVELAVKGNFARDTLDELNDEDVDIDFNTTPDDQDGRIDPKQFLPDDPISNKLFRGTDEAAEEASESARSIFNRDNRSKTPNFGGSFRKESDKATKAFKKNSDAVDFLKHKIKSTGPNISNLRDSFLEFGTSADDSIKSVRDSLSFSSIKGSGAEFLDTLSSKAGSVRKSILSAGSGIDSFIRTTEKGRLVTLKDAAAKAIAAPANLALAAAEFIASSGALALASSLAVATGGVLILAGVIGGLAVGIITNFDEIKTAAKGTFSTLKEAMTLVADLAIGFFIGSWNLIVDILQSVFEGFSPLIKMFKDLASTFGLFEGGASTMGIFASAISFLKGVMNGLFSALDILVDVLGAVLTLFTTLLRVALTPVIVGFQLFVKGAKMAIGILKDFFNIGGGEDSPFSSLIQGLKEFATSIPQTVEKMVNGVIDRVNKFFEMINNSPLGVDVGQIDRVDFGQESALDASRSELGSDGMSMFDSMAEKGDKKIMYNEDSSTNIEQTIDADPEDQAKLSRVVSDAISQANSFERRRQGGQ